MLKKYSILAVFAIFILSIVSMTIYLVNDFRSIISPETIALESIRDKEVEEIKPKEYIWIEGIVKREQKEYSYAATELDIRLDYQDAMKNRDYKHYRIDVENLDSYKFFCINQVLKSKNILYSYYKVDGLIKIAISESNRDLLNDALKEIKKYKIDYTIKEIN